jgi:hypothetical protein
MKTNAKRAEEQLDTLTNVTTRLGASLSDVATTAQATGALANELDRAAKVLPELISKSEQLGVQFDSVVGASARIERHLAAMPEQIETTRSLSTDVTQVLKAMVDSVDNAAISSRELQRNASEAAVVMNGVNVFLATTSGLQSTVGELEQVLARLTKTVQSTQAALSDSTTGIKTSVAASADLLEADVKRSTEAASLLTDRLIAVAQGIIDQTQQQQSVTA